MKRLLVVFLCLAFLAVAVQTSQAQTFSLSFGAAPRYYAPAPWYGQGVVIGQSGVYLGGGVVMVDPYVPYVPYRTPSVPYYYYGYGPSYGYSIYPSRPSVPHCYHHNYHYAPPSIHGYHGHHGR